MAKKTTRGQKRNFIKTRTAATQRRDKYGRFVKINKLGFVNRQPPRQRDAHGRFVSQAVRQAVRRDKYGRFARATLPWHRRRAVMLLPVVLCIVGALFFGWQLSRPIIIEKPVAVAQPSAPTPSPPQVFSEVTVTLQKSEPVRLRIPKIAVDTSFIAIGKEADGSLEVPGRPDVVGWYNRAPTPGELGPAIVVGHVDRPGGTAVFWRLRELLPGDTFEIARADGTIAEFKVDSVKQFRQDNFPTKAVYGNIDHAGIRLITCGGVFDRQARKYSHNTVVYGSLVVNSNSASDKNGTPGRI